MAMKSTIIAMILLVFGALLVSACNPGPKPEKPNILLITLDTTRADRIGCYGYEKAHTPNMDALCQEGVRFDLAVAQAAVTPVSHASILTGLYPYQHGLRVIHGKTLFRLEEGSHPTLARVLKRHGYSTAAFLSAFTVSEYFGLQQGFDLFDTGIEGDLNRKMFTTIDGRSDWDVDLNQRRADVTTDHALAWLETRSDPFFMWVHYFDPHDMKLTPSEEFLKPYLKEARSFEDLLRQVYDGEVAFMDLQIGRIFDALKTSDQYDNTLIIITNDHGQGLGDHDWWTHRILYQEQIRMPLIVRTPDGPSNRSCSALVRSIDIMPTALDYAGIAPLPVEGRSLRGLMRGELEPERMAYADSLMRLDDNRPEDLAGGIHDDLMYCVMTRTWKLIHRRFHEDASELY
ncbi:MAG: sulfatase, partial [Planctomycetota bacterium]